MCSDNFFFQVSSKVGDNFLFPYDYSSNYQHLFDDKGKKIEEKTRKKGIDRRTLKEI